MRARQKLVTDKTVVIIVVDTHILNAGGSAGTAGEKVQKKSVIDHHRHYVIIIDSRFLRIWNRRHLPLRNW